MRLIKWFLSLIIAFAFTETQGQVITGRVLADTSNKPVIATLTTHSGHQTSSDVDGNFNIQVSGIGDTIKILAVEYQSYSFPIKAIKKDYITIRLKTNIVKLNGVTITA